MARLFPSLPTNTLSNAFPSIFTQLRGRTVRYRGEACRFFSFMTPSLFTISPSAGRYTLRFCTRKSPWLEAAPHGLCISYGSSSLPMLCTPCRSVCFHTGFDTTSSPIIFFSSVTLITLSSKMSQTPFRPSHPDTFLHHAVKPPFFPPTPSWSPLSGRCGSLRYF